MKTASIRNELVTRIDKLPRELQLRVLDFAKNLTPKGIKGKNLLRFEGVIPPDDLQFISEAIEKGCEGVDNSEW